MSLINRFNSNHNFIEQPIHPFEIGGCTPPVKKKSGVCLIVGTHPCYKEDMDAALAIYPDADICGVNEAAALVKCDHLATCHGEKAAHFLRVRKDKKRPTLHIRDNEHPKEKIKYHAWSIQTMAGSATFACVAMLLTGYDKVIMCGCPMDGGGGYALKDTHKGDRYDPRIGYSDGASQMIRGWHNAMRKFKGEHPDMAARICSMSGKTKEVFGGLDGIE